jgi:hypothetical protein
MGDIVVGLVPCLMSVDMKIRISSSGKESGSSRWTSRVTGGLLNDHWLDNVSSLVSLTIGGGATCVVSGVSSVEVSFIPGVMSVNMETRRWRCSRISGSDECSIKTSSGACTSVVINERVGIVVVKTD